MATIKEIAAIAEVSISTVSRVLNIEILNFLYELGHRKIGFIGGKKLEKLSEEKAYVDERDIKYKEFMEQKGIYNPEYISRSRKIYF